VERVCEGVGKEEEEDVEEEEDDDDDDDEEEATEFEGKAHLGGVESKVITGSPVS
jgi:hypothetical protein